MTEKGARELAARIVADTEYDREGSYPNEWWSDVKVEEMIFEALEEQQDQLAQAQATIKSLTEENAALRALLDKFITKSNGLSLWVRDEALSKKLEDYDDFLHERIVTMYEHQCKAEAILNGESNGM